MEIHTKEELLRSIKNTLENYPAQVPHFQLPVFDKPPACRQKVFQYEGGEFDPEIAGAGYIVDAVGQGREVRKVLTTINTGAKWGLKTDGGRNIEVLAHLGLLKELCSCRARGGHNLDQKRDFTLYKFYLPQNPNKYLATPTTQEAAAVGGSSAPSGGAASPGASPNAKGPDLYIVMNMMRTTFSQQAPAGIVEQGAATVASTPPVTTKEDAPAPTTTDAPSAFGAASEITPDEFSEQVTGLVERFSEAAISSDGGASAGEGVEGAAASNSGAAACAMIARGARCEINGLVPAPQHNGKRCTLTDFYEASGR